MVAESKAKKCFFSTLISLFFILFLIAILVITVDPYFHFHKPLPFLSHRLSEERYINDGISRHFSFDGLITGTSMTQNFKPSEMDTLFGTTSVKEPFAGAGYQELSENLDRTLQRNPDCKTVLLAVDYNGFLRDANWKQYIDYPDYLYDNNPFNDVSYLFNKSILYHGVLSSLRMTLGGEETTTMDEYSSWDRETGLDIVMQSYDRTNVKKDPSPKFSESDYNNVTETIQRNFVDLFEKYPDVTFYIFYPPYSICYFDALVLKGTLEKQLQAEQVATELLLNCENVKLYNFFDQYDIITNLDYYCDDGHYDSEVNSMILQWMADDVGRVTKENYLEKIQAERVYFSEYDYEGIYSELTE